MAERYDVIIIGSGAGGGTLAHRLASSGKKILILERGDWLPREALNWSVEGVFGRNRYVSPETWLLPDGTPFQPQVHYFVGGATKVFGAALYRLRKEDFGEMRHYDDGVSPAWPIGYDELEPYYTQAEQLYQRAWRTRPRSHRAAGQRALSGAAGLARTAHPEAVRRPDRRRLPPVSRAVGRDAERAGHGLQPVASGVRPATDSRASCTRNPTPRSLPCAPRWSGPT